MGLRDFLTNLGSVNELTGGLRQQAEQQRQQDTLNQLRQTLPQQLNNKDYGDIAAQAMGAGPAGMQLSREVLDKIVANQTKPKVPTLSPEQIKAMNVGGVTPDVANALQGIPAQQQIAAIGSVQKSRAEDMQAKAENRRQDTYQSAQGSSLLDKVNGETKKDREALETFNKILAVKDQDFTGANHALVVGALRSVAGEVGRLPFQEQATVFAHTRFQDTQQFENWLENASKGTIPPEVKGDLVTLIQNAQQAVNNSMSKKAADIAQEHINARRGSMLKGGEPDPVVSDLVNQYDLQASVKAAKNGGHTISLKPKGASGAGAPVQQGAGDGGQAMSADAIKNPAAKAFVTDYLQKNPDISPEKKAAIISNAMKE